MDASENDAKKLEAFVDAFISTWAIHKQGEPSQMIIDTYYNVLEKYSVEQIIAAFSYAVSELQWFPKPVELRKFIESGPGDVSDIALIEADKVVNAIRDHGYYKSVTFDDPVTMAVIVHGWGGWMKVCELRDNDIKWFRKDFVPIYKAYSNQGIKHHGHLVGYHEDHNILKYPESVPDPVLIGDENKARKVLAYNNKLKLVGG